MSDQYTPGDPTTRYPRPTFDEHLPERPGLAQDMQPKPDHGEDTYR